jgi:hypothetical protein
MFPKALSRNNTVECNFKSTHLEFSFSHYRYKYTHTSNPPSLVLST